MITDLNSLLKFIPADDYGEWVSVGMALKHEGYPCSVWDDWSKNSNKYKEGECERKWNSFNERTTKIVTGGTIYQMAVNNGYKPIYTSENLDVHNLLLKPIIDPSFVEREKIPMPSNMWDGKGELIEYLQTLFKPDDFVGYCVNLQKRSDGGFYPSKGIFTRKASDLIEALQRSKNIDEAMGTVGDGGAYIRFNPLDGKGEGNSNVTKRNYCLIESDVDAIDKQYSLFKAMNLPIEFLVNSGGKSLHAIVHVDAANEQQYRERVNTLYTFCEKNGLTPDKQDKNESRYSRMPGVLRGDKKQYIVERHMGAKSFSEWEKWAEEQADDLPDTETLADVWDNMPDLAPELIKGVLREGHKMLIAGPSKAGKSFLLMNLAVSFAEGIEWLGLKCMQGKVLYINLELDKVSCEHRFKDIYRGLGISPQNKTNIIIWNLRGRAAPIEKLTPSIIRRFKSANLEAIIIDPIYKILGDADENSAGDMSKFCNHFDEIALQCNCAVIYCHHHSKGATGKYMNAADRSSGSGVFARDPDAILDLSELNCDKVIDKYKKQNPDATEGVTAWELSGSFREFGGMKPKRLWFDWPIHKVDTWNFLASSEYADSKGQTGVSKDQTSKNDWLDKAEDMLKMAEVDGNNCVDIADLGISYKNAINKFTPKTTYRVAKISDEIQVVTRRTTEGALRLKRVTYVENPDPMKKGYIVESEETK